MREESNHHSGVRMNDNITDNITTLIAQPLWSSQVLTDNKLHLSEILFYFADRLL